MSKRNRYKELERPMTICLITSAVLFLLYLVFAALHITWLKVLLAIGIYAITIGCLVLLYLCQELLRPRSLWLSTGFFSLLLCITVSLILAFP